MPIYERILFATDFSEQANQAQVEAVKLARESGAELHVLYVDVIAGRDAGAFTDPTLPDYVRKVEQVSLSAFPGATPISYGRTVFKICRDQSPTAGILRYAGEINADLIVLGTRGRSALYEMVLGSVAQDVARAAPVSALVVGAMPHEAARCVLAPIDFTPGSFDALAHAGRIAEREQLPLLVLYVVNFDRVEHPEELPVGERERRAGIELDRVVALAKLPVATETLVTVGPAADEIVRVAAERHAGLLVMAASQHTALQRVLLLGSVTKAVIRRAPCPVMVSRPRTEPAVSRVAA